MRESRILAVDDEPMALEILARFLGAKGHRVVGAASAEAASELLRGGAFDFVLCDVVLPGRTGLQALAEFRKLTRAPIHMMSGQSDDDARRDALLLGAAGFFGKPLDLSEISAAVDALPERAA